MAMSGSGPGGESRKNMILRLANNPSDMNAEYGGLTVANIRKNVFVVLVCGFAVTGALCFGIDQGLMSVILVMKQFQDQYPEVADGAASQGFHKGLVTALLELGAFVGSFITPHISDHLSRRMAMRVGCFFFLVGAAIQTAAPSYAALVAGRFIGGIGIGLLSSTMGVYVSEISPPNLRGILLDFNELFVVSGIVIAFWVCYGTRLFDGDLSFRLPFGLQMIPGLVLFGAMKWLPESPRWLVMQERETDALDTLAKLRGRDLTDPAVLAEWVSMRAEVEVGRQALQRRHPKLIAESDKLKNKVKLDLVSWADTWGPNVWRRTLISVMVAFFQQMVGINALIYYAPSMVKALGFSYDQQLIQSGIINITQLAGIFISLVLIDKAGRKPLLIFGALGMTICMVIVGILIKLFSSSWGTHQVEAKVALAFLNLYMVIFGTTWGPVAWALPSELFPSSLRARGVAWSVMSIWMFNFIVGLIVPPMLDSIGWGTFIFFAAFAALAGLWALVCVKETKGKTLEEIDLMFKDKPKKGKESGSGSEDEISGSSLAEEMERQKFLGEFAEDAASRGGFVAESDGGSPRSKSQGQHVERV